MTSAAFASLAAPVLEDSMELSSSPAGNSLDADIDIDIGDYPAGNDFFDDENMLDDPEPVRPATATDQMMDDDDHTLVAPLNEAEMHDGPDVFETVAPQSPEDELIEYDDIDQLDQAHFHVTDTAQSTHTDSGVPSADVPAPENAGNAETLHGTEVTLIEETKSVVTDGVDEPEPVQIQSDTLHTSVPESQNLEPDAAKEEQDSTADAAHNTDAPVDDVNEPSLAQPALAADRSDGDVETEAAQSGKGPELDQDALLKPTPEPLGTIDTNLGHVANGPSTPTDTGLHSMTLKFGDYEMPLFKSHVQPTGLLKDDNLANVSLADLIRSCRERLSLKIGEEYVSNTQDLVLNFDQMGMMLFESSRAASSTSLSDVLEIYLALHKNDGVDDAPALQLSLRPQLFSAVFEGFKQAVAEGAGMLRFTREIDTDGLLQSGEAAENITQEAQYHPNKQENDEPAATYDKSENSEDYGFHFDEEDNGQDDYGEYIQQEDQANEDAEDAEETQHLDDSATLSHKEYPGPEDDLSQFEDDEAHGHEPDGDEKYDDQDPANENSDEAFHPKSTASSDTVRGDVRDDRPYDNDDTGNEHDGNSATLPDGEVEDDLDAPAGNQFSGEDEYQNLDDEQTGEEPKTADTDNGQEATVLVYSEDFANEALYDDADDGHGSFTAIIETSYDEDAAGNLNFVGEEADTQANDAEQPEDDLDPNEESEYYHTALDLLDGTAEAHDASTSGEAVEAPHVHDHPDHDDIGYDDDDDDDEQAIETTAELSNSPTGKRSFEEHADDGEYDDLDEPDLKKARSG